MSKTPASGSGAGSGRRLIESGSFPFEFVSELAEMESWRKEVYRPVYHILSVNDRRVIVISQFLVAACAGRSADELGDVLSRKLTDLDLAAMRLLTDGSEGIGKQAAHEATELAFFEKAKPVKRGRQESAGVSGK
jgi:hypothetical protein